MKIMKKDMKPNEQVTTFFALESMQLRKSKKNDNFLVLGLYDKTGKINGYLWHEPVEMAATIKERTIVKVRGIVTMVNGSLTINVGRIRTAEKREVDMEDFLDTVTGGINLWYGRLLKVVGNIGDISCKRLVQAFLDDSCFVDFFMTAPGGIRIHHHYVGGLLEHTVSSMELAAQFADRHPGLIDRDLIQVGAS